MGFIGRVRVLIIAIALLLALGAPQAMASVPGGINFQGYLTDITGTPVDGTVTMVLRLYDADTGGIELWNETQSVSVNKGLYSITLGSISQIDTSVLDATALYLEVTVGGQTMSPRQAVTSVAFARRAETADSISTATLGGLLCSAGQVAAWSGSQWTCSEIIADSAVTTAKIANSSVTTEKLADSAVTTAKIANSSVTTEKLADSSVATAKIANSSVITEKLADSSVTSAKIATPLYLSGSVSADGIIKGTNTSSTGSGLYGYASATSGDNRGVTGATASVSGIGVYGIASHPFGGAGVFGQGVYGGYFYSDDTDPLATLSSGVYGRGGLRGGHFETYEPYGAGVLGFAGDTSQASHGVVGQTSSPTGVGVYGYAPVRGVLGHTHQLSGLSNGVTGFSESVDGTGVYGEAPFKGVVGNSTAATGLAYGGYFTNNSISGYGVYGYSSNTDGSNYGGQFMSASAHGIGVYALAPTRGVYGHAISVTGITNGVSGKSESTDGIGVYGEAPLRGVRGSSTAATGLSNGVEGISASTSGAGIYGESPYKGVFGNSTAASGFGYGFYGISASDTGRGVYGRATATTGSTIGAYGVSESTSGAGVKGLASAASGTTYGGHFTSNSTDGYGVYASASATTGTNYGVYGKSNSSTGYDFYAGGAGINMGPFTGAHETVLAEGFPVDTLPGMIVSVTGKALARYDEDGNVTISSTMPTVRLSSAPNDKAVFGAFVAEVALPEDHWHAPQPGERFGAVNALGEGRVWVTDINGDIQAGDYITTSAVPGYGQRQDDDLLHSYTLGKATEDVDWDSVTTTVILDGVEYKAYLIAVVYTSG